MNPADTSTPHRGGHGGEARPPGRRDGPDARTLALLALHRIDDGAYANLVTAQLLGGSGLDPRDRRFVTELVHGITRMRRALDFQIGCRARGRLDRETQQVLRLGAYQLLYLQTPAHAAVDASVRLAPHRSRRLVNAVLRRMAAEGVAPWPDEPTRLSYPDWIVSGLVGELGRDEGLAALDAMNRPRGRLDRDDGYAQDLASQWVADAVGARAGERILDLCAAPGGKATGMARSGAEVVALDIHAHRVALIAGNARRLPAAVGAVLADGRTPPFPPASFDRVLVDAPCSGLGVLHRRPDARWRVTPAAVAELSALQQTLLTRAVELVRPGGTLVYSVCTLTSAESTGIDDWLASAAPRLRPLEPLGAPWQPIGRGVRLLPHWAGTDGMALFRYELSHPPASP